MAQNLADILGRHRCVISGPFELFLEVTINRL